MAEPPPIPRRPQSAPPPAFAYVSEPESWSPIPLTIAAATWSMFVSFFCVFVAPKFRQIFADFKVDIPLITQWTLWLCELLSRNFLWVALIVACVLPPLIVIPNLPVPPDPRRRATIARRVRWLGTLIFLLTIATIVIACAAPMVAVTNIVSGPQKN